MGEHSEVGVDTLVMPVGEDKGKVSDCTGPAAALVRSQDLPSKVPD